MARNYYSSSVLLDQYVVKGLKYLNLSVPTLREGEKLYLAGNTINRRTASVALLHEERKNYIWLDRKLTELTDVQIQWPNYRKRWKDLSGWIYD